MEQKIIRTAATTPAPTTAPTFSDVWGPCSLVRCQTVAECIRAGTPTVGALARRYGADAVQACIEGCIVSLRDFVNLRATMTDAQARMTAELAVGDWRVRNLTVADIMMIFRRAKMGEWGEFYGRLDGQMILGWFGKYFDERQEAAARISEVEAHQHSDRDRRTYTPEIVQRLVGEHWAQRKRQRDIDTPGWDRPELPVFNEQNAAFYTSHTPKR